MATSEARIPTDRAERFLAQLCRHASMIGSGPNAAHSETAPRRDVTVTAEWSGTAGTITFAPWGRCDLTATTDALIAHVEAPNTGYLEQIQTVIGRNLERMSHRTPLTVEWAEVDVLPNSGSPTATKDGRRPKLRLAAITVIAALAVTAHLMLGGSLITDQRLTSAAVLLFLTLAGLKLATIVLARRGVIALARSRHHGLLGRTAQRGFRAHGRSVRPRAVDL
nr:DUF2218 domain-containing protein [Nocardia sp. GTS18]